MTKKREKPVALTVQGVGESDASLELSREERAGIIVLFARGYTVRYIRQFLERRAAERGRAELVPNEGQLLRLAVMYSKDVAACRDELAKDIIQRGLIRKEERVRRLTELAESIERDAQSGLNLKATEEYRRVLADIRTEAEGLNIRILVPDDPWLQLLQDLKEKAALRLPGPTQSSTESELVPDLGKLTPS